MEFLRKIAIKFISWSFRVEKIDKIELVIRDNGYTYYNRNFTKEEQLKRVLSKIK